MLDYLRSLPPGFGHEDARAAIAASTYYLREVFGAQHALAVTAELVGPLVATAPEAEPAPIGGEAPGEVPAATLH